MRWRGRILAAGAVGVATLAFPAAGWAAEAEGCSGSFASFGPDAQPLSFAEAPGAGGTASDPFRVHPEGVVTWQGQTDVAITDGAWSVAVAGLPFLSGTIDDEANERVNGGEQAMDVLPGFFQAMLSEDIVIPVGGEISKDGAVVCRASGYIGGTSSTLSSPIFMAGAFLTIAGTAMAGVVIARTRAVGPPDSFDPGGTRS